MLLTHYVYIFLRGKFNCLIYLNFFVTSGTYQTYTKSCFSYMILLKFYKTKFDVSPAPLRNTITTIFLVKNIDKPKKYAMQV